MSLWREFWGDEGGGVVSAELVAVGTVAVVGGTVGMNMLGASVNEELRETAHAVRSLNQSYFVTGHVSKRAWKAGSFYTQPDVRKSIEELDAMICDEPERPAIPQAKPKKKAKRSSGDQVDDQDDRDTTAFLQADDAALLPPDPVEADDDVSKMETVIEPAPEA